MTWRPKQNNRVEAEVYEITESYADDDKVFALGRQKVVSKATGKSFETAMDYVLTMREGKIAKVNKTCDTAAAMVAFTPE